MFYINYEECKLYYKVALFFSWACFILTMRNVNKKELEALLDEKACFILTMRNVNG